MVVVAVEGNRAAVRGDTALEPLLEPLRAEQQAAVPQGLLPWQAGQQAALQAEQLQPHSHWAAPRHPEVVSQQELLQGLPQVPASLAADWQPLLPPWQPAEHH